MKLKIHIIISLFVTMIIISCASAPSFQELNTRSEELYEMALELEQKNRKEEAFRVMDVLSSLYPNDTKIKDFLAKYSEEDKEILQSEGNLGFNKAIRARVVPTTTEKVLWYIPDRFLDLIEVGDYWINFGPQFGLGGQVTGAVQAELFSGAYAGVGFGQKKMLGIKTEARSAVVVGPFGPVALASSSAGTGGFQFGYGFEYFHTPKKPIYQDIKDYWGIGGRGGLFIIGVEVMFHPVEAVDFLGGIFLMDPLNDDFATTRKLDYTSRQRDSIKTFNSTVRSFEREDLDDYRKKYSTISTKQPTISPKTK